jgi:hypothetical protein
MRKSNESSLKQAIDDFLDTYRLREKMNEVKIIEAWSRVMNEAICKRTAKIRFREGILHLDVTSAPLREELNYQRDKIRETMNAELGGDYIKDVIVR